MTENEKKMRAMASAAQRDAKRALFAMVLCVAFALVVLAMLMLQPGCGAEPLGAPQVDGGVDVLPLLPPPNTSPSRVSRDVDAGGDR